MSHFNWERLQTQRRMSQQGTEEFEPAKKRANKRKRKKERDKRLLEAYIAFRRGKIVEIPPYAHQISPEVKQRLWAESVRRVPKKRLNKHQLRRAHEDKTPRQKPSEQVFVVRRPGVGTRLVRRPVGEPDREECAGTQRQA